MDPKQQAQEWLDGVVARGREAWDKVTPQEKQVVTDTLVDLAKLRVAEAAGKDVSGEIPIAEATLRNMAMVTALLVRRTIFDVIADSLKQVTSVLPGLLKAIVK